MGKHSKLAFWAMVALCLFSEKASGDDIHVELRCSKSRYLIGEPVRVKFCVTNRSNQPIRVWVEQLKHQNIRIYNSPDGETFKEYTIGDRVDFNLIPDEETLDSNDTKCYPLSILHTFHHKETVERRSRLAFPEPGLYFAKLTYQTYSSKVLESNTVKIEVKEPEGVDAQVWEKMQGKYFLYFLQRGMPYRRGEDSTVKAAGILKEHPKSGYAPALKWALKEYYQKRRKTDLTRAEALADEEITLIREVTGIKEPLPGPFPNDVRLDVRITYHYPQWTPLKRVFEDLSKQTNIPLRLDEGLTIRKMKGIPQARKLREFMRDQSAYKSKWVEDGNGYKLIPD